MRGVIQTDLRDLVAEKSSIIAGWMAVGKIARTERTHLIFSIWALTPHYADFDVQVRAVLGDGIDPFAGADIFWKRC
ncbi:MAG: TetR family transcriptional regulator C-terminal domain-containing protein [Cypionkella sp.]|nr:TetR family transcriptional regulator C-terminal domain-containing protein [Cypionkella sp.]